MKRFLIIVLIVTVLIFSASCGKNKEQTTKKQVDNSVEIAVTVGDVDYSMERFSLYFYNAQDEILKESGYKESKDIPEDFWDIAVNGVTRLDIAKEEALNMLIDDAIEYQKAREYNIKLTADELFDINNRMSMLRQDKVSMAQFEYMGISVAELEEYYKDEMLIPSLVTELINEDAITPSAESVLEEFQKSYVKVRQIFVPTVDAITGKPFSSENLKAAKDKINAAMEKLKNGAEFDEVADEYTQDYYTQAYADGYIITIEDWPKEAEEAAFSLYDEEISELITSSEGFHIIKRMPFDFEGVQELSCLESIEAEFAEPKLKKLVKKWRKETKVKINDSAFENLKPLITNNQALSVKVK